MTEGRVRVRVRAGVGVRVKVRGKGRVSFRHEANARVRSYVVLMLGWGLE